MINRLMLLKMKSSGRMDNLHRKIGSNKMLIATKKVIKVLLWFGCPSSQYIQIQSE